VPCCRFQLSDTLRREKETWKQVFHLVGSLEFSNMTQALMKLKGHNILSRPGRQVA